MKVKIVFGKDCSIKYHNIDISPEKILECVNNKEVLKLENDDGAQIINFAKVCYVVCEENED